MSAAIRDRSHARTRRRRLPPICTRRLRHRASRRHDPHHARHAARIRRRDHTRLAVARHPADLPRARPRGPDRRALHPRGHEPGSRAPAAHAGALPPGDRQDRSRCACATRSADPRRLQGVLVAADDHSATLLLDDGAERVVVDRRDRQGRTVFEWGPKPKPGKQPRPRSPSKQCRHRSSRTDKSMNPSSTKEKQPS